MSDAESSSAAVTDVTPLVDPVGSDGGGLDQIIPAVYHRPLSWKNWVRRALPFMIVGMVAMITVLLLPFVDFLGGWLTIIGTVLSIAIVALATLMTYREYWRWLHSPYYADPEEGVLFQYQAKSKWLFLLGSAPKTLDLDTAEYLPRPQTFWENYLPLKGFQNSCTITVDGPGQHDAEHFSDIRDFMYGEQISAIIMFRKHRDQLYQTADLGLQERQALAAERTVELLLVLTDKIDQLTTVIKESNRPSLPAQETPSSIRTPATPDEDA